MANLGNENFEGMELNLSAFYDGKEPSKEPPKKNGMNERKLNENLAAALENLEKRESQEAERIARSFPPIPTTNLKQIFEAQEILKNLPPAPKGPIDMRKLEENRRKAHELYNKAVFDYNLLVTFFKKSKNEQIRILTEFQWAAYDISQYSQSIGGSVPKVDMPKFQRPQKKGGERKTMKLKLKQKQNQKQNQKQKHNKKQNKTRKNRF